MAQITYCPPAPENQKLHFDRHAFSSRHQYAVEANYVGANNGSEGWKSTGIDFESYSRMGTKRRKQRGERRLPTPAYALDNNKQQAVIIRYLEIRAGFQRRRLPYTLHQRTQIVYAMLKWRADREEKRMDACAQEYVRLRSEQLCTEYEERMKMLQREIVNLDTAIRVNRNPACIPLIVKYYYFGTSDSTGVAAEFGFKSCHVRQILKRLSNLADKIEAGQT
jgi:hypothetical protein